MKQGQCICPLSWSVHTNFSGEGKCNERGWACTPHPHQPGQILPSSLNVRQKAAVATLCTLWVGLSQHWPMRANDQYSSRPPWLHVQSFPASKRRKFTITALYLKFETYIPKNETARPRYQFLQYVSESDLYCIFPRSVLFAISCNFPALLERTLGSTAGGSFLPSPLLLLCSHKWLIYKFPISKITDHE